MPGHAPPDGKRAGALSGCAEQCAHRRSQPPEVRPFELTTEGADRPPEEVRDAVELAVTALPRTEIVMRTGEYLHAESTSRIFRFVDDLEVYVPPGASELVVRSESRVGGSDMGVNVARVNA